MANGEVTDKRYAGGHSRVAAWNPWIVLVAAILLAYHNSFAGKLAFDDHAYLGTDKFARLESLAAASNRPFLFWTFAANHRWAVPTPLATTRSIWAFTWRRRSPWHCWSGV